MNLSKGVKNLPVDVNMPERTANLRESMPSKVGRIHRSDLLVGGAKRFRVAVRFRVQAGVEDTFLNLGVLGPLGALPQRPRSVAQVRFSYRDLKSFGLCFRVG